METATTDLLSLLQVPDGTLEQPITITIIRNSERTHTLRCIVGEETVTICQHSEETEITWTPPIDLAWQMPYSVNTVVYTLETEGLGETQYTATLTVPNIKPTLRYTWRDVSGAPFLLISISALEVEVEAEAAYGATISHVSVGINGRPYHGSVLRERFNGMQVKVTDSRGRTTVAYEDLEAKPYTRPTLSLSGSRCEADGTPNEMGEFVCLTATYSFMHLPGRQARLTLAGTEETVETSGSLQRILPAPSSASTLFEARLTDGVDKRTHASFRLPVAYATVDFLAGGKGIAFGTTAVNEGFTCNMDADFCGRTVTGLPAPAHPTAPVTRESLLELIYPVGSIYLSVNATSPSVLFGGTWERIQDRFLLAAGSTYGAGTTGGSDKHYHSLSDAAVALINHHDGKFWFYEIEGVSYVATGSGSSSGANVNANQSAAVPLRGGTDWGSTMPPYLAVYIWKRTA